MWIFLIALGVLFSFIAITSSDTVFERCIIYREQTRKRVSDYYSLAEDYVIHRLLKL